MTIKDNAITPFVVKVEDNQFVLYEEKTTAKGETHEDPIGYFINLSVLIRRIAHLKLARRNEQVDLGGFIAEYKAAYRGAESAINICSPSKILTNE